MNPAGKAFNVKLPPEVTGVLGAPLIEALALVGVIEVAPATLPAPAVGAEAVSNDSSLAAEVSS